MLKVLDIALAEVGYRESAGNVTKYAAELDKLGGFYNGAKNGYAWCDVFVDWCFVRAYGRELAQKLLCQPDYSAGAGCTYSAQYYQRAGRWRTVPQVGAQIFFGNATESHHTGLVYAVDGKYVYTVEGNTSDGVYKRQYAIGAGNIYGYGMPDYSLVEPPGADGPDYGGVYAQAAQNWHEDGTETTTGPAAMCAVELPELRRGDASEAVRSMQTLLIARHFACGADGADGDFGPATRQAVLNFQGECALEADGVCGAQSWAALING